MNGSPAHLSDSGFTGLTDFAECLLPATLVIFRYCGIYKESHLNSV